MRRQCCCRPPKQNAHNSFATIDHKVDAILKRRLQRKAEEARIAAQAARDASLAAAAAAEEDAAGAAAEERAERARAGHAARVGDLERDAREELEGGDGEGGDDEGRTAAPEPPTVGRLISPCAAPALPDLAELAPVQRLLRAAPHLTAPEAFRLLVSQRAALPRPPDEATARAAFAVACHSPDAAAAEGAAAALLDWCGAPPRAAAADCRLDLGDLELEPGARAPASAPWVPGAADFLQALRGMGVSGAAAAAGGSGGAGGGAGARGGHASSSAPAAAAAAATGRGKQQQKGKQKQQQQQQQQQDGEHSQQQQQQQQQQLAYRDANLPLLLRLIAALCAPDAPGALPRPRPHLPEGHGRALAAALLQLHADGRARAAALAQLHEAAGALLDAFGDTEWGRVLPDLAARFAAGIGPSHRAALCVLSELPTAGASGRARALQRAGALALLRWLVAPDEKAAAAAIAAAAKAGGRGAAAGGAVSALDAVQALGRSDRDVAALLQRLSGGGGGGQAAVGAKRQRGGGGGGGAAAAAASGAPDFWALQSALEAADLVLWSFVDEPTGGALAATLFRCLTGPPFTFSNRPLHTVLTPLSNYSHAQHATDTQNRPHRQAARSTSASPASSCRTSRRSRGC